MQISEVDDVEKQIKRAQSMNFEDESQLGEEGSMTGIDFEEMSAVTMPSVEEYHILDYSKPIKEVKKLTTKSLRRKKVNDDEQGFDYGADMRSNEARASVIPMEVRVKLAKAAETKKKERKAFLPEEEDFYRPKDVIILCFAMVSGHGDLEPFEKEMANKWLHIWDDGSRRYRCLVLRGMSIGGL